MSFAKPSPDPDFASRRLCVTPHQVQEGEPRVQERHLLLGEYGGGHLGMSCRDTDNLQKNCIAYIYIERESYFFPHRGKEDSGLSLETIQPSGPVGICLVFSVGAVRGPLVPETLFSALRAMLGEGPLLKSAVGRSEGWRPGTVFGAFPSPINPECPWLRPRKQRGTVRRKKYKSRSKAFFEGEIINCNLIT